MTQYPEAWLCRELGMAVVNIALITDYDAGVLTLRIPVAEKAKPRTVAVPARCIRLEPAHAVVRVLHARRVWRLRRQRHVDGHVPVSSNLRPLMTISISASASSL